MTMLKQPFAAPRDRDRSPNDLDGVLRAFFQSEMPKPWPELKRPAETTFRLEPSARQRRTLVHSRGVLAASLLVLLIGYGWLSGMGADSAFVTTELTGKNEAFHRQTEVKPVKMKADPHSSLSRRTHHYPGKH
jgi:hypothetical protein